MNRKTLRNGRAHQIQSLENPYGQVPHTGWLKAVSALFVENSLCIEPRNKDTRQCVKSWFKLLGQLCRSRLDYKLVRLHYNTM